MSARVAPNWVAWHSRDEFRLQTLMASRPSQAPDIEGMRRLFARGDRERPDVFVGRDEPITALTNALQNIEAVGGIRGSTRIVQGAPGAGKTALLNELLARWQSKTTAGTAHLPLVLNVQPDAFASRVGLVAELHRSMGGGDLELPAGSKSRDSRTGVRGLGVEATRGTTSTSNVATPEITFHTLRDRFPKWQRPIVLLVDEAQQIRPDADRPEPTDAAPLNLSIAELHRGDHSLPILPIYFGLSTTRAHIAELGASRLADETTFGLDPLSSTECYRGAHDTLMGYRPLGRQEELERWAQACAHASDGWPQHLHNNIRACCETLAEADGDLGRGDLTAAMAKGAQMRQRYYDERTESVGRHAAAAMQAVSETAKVRPNDRTRHLHPPPSRTGRSRRHTLVASNRHRRSPLQPHPPRRRAPRNGRQPRPLHLPNPLLRHLPPNRQRALADDLAVPARVRQRPNPRPKCPTNRR